nr:acyltransferase [uncultured Desulfobacter sp.]
MRTVKGKFKRPSKLEYFFEIIKAMLSLRFYKVITYAFAYFIVNFVVGRNKAKIEKSAKVHPSVIIRQGERVSIGKDCLINHNNVIQAGKFAGKVKIGNYVHTGPNVMIFAFNHGIEKNGQPSIKQDYWDGDVVIDDDVWIGAGTVVTAGVRIGKGAVIGSNSVVTTDIPPYSIYGGVPARLIRERG